MPDITKLAAQLRAAIARFNAADRGPGGYGLEDYGPAWRELNALCSPANLTTLLDALDALRVDAERARKTSVPSVDDMAALIRQLAHSLRSARPSHDLPARALDYLKRHGLQGTVLREAEYMRQEAFDSLPDDYETN